MPKKVNKTRTIKQTKLIKLVLENVGKKGDTKTLGEMMLEAGYSEAMAKGQNGIALVLKNTPELKELLDKLMKHRDRVIIQMERKLYKANYRDAVEGFDKITKNIELMSGRATERNAVLSDEERDKIMALKKRK